MDDVLWRAARFARFGQSGGNEFLNYRLERTAFWFRACRHVVHQLSVEATGFPARSVQTTAWVEICVGYHQLALHGYAAHQVHEKGFSGAVFANNQAKDRSTFRNVVQIFLQGGNFGITTDLDVPGTK